MREGSVAVASVLGLTLFGPFGASLRGSPVVLRGRKSCALLAYLAVHPARSAPREKLAELLWTGRAPAQARGSLRQALAEIRSACRDGPCLLADRASVRIDGCEVEHETVRLANAVAEGEVALQLACLDSIRGDFLEGFEGISPAFDDWLMGERVRQQERLVALLLDCAGAALARAQPEGIARILGAVERIDPFNEAAVRSAMQADGLKGDVAALHRRYHQFRERLAREFGAAPAAETQALFAQLGSRGRDWQVAVLPLAPAPEQPPPIAATRPLAPPVVVLAPIAAIDGEDEAVRLAAICTDEIHSAIAALRDLRVIRPEAAPGPRLEELLESSVATFVLTGRLWCSETHLRFNLSLENAATGITVWSDRGRLERRDIETAIDGIVEKAARAVLPAIDRELGRELAREMGRDPAGRAGAEPDVETLFALARAQMRHSRSLAEARNCADLLEHVIEREPRHLGALLMLTRMYNTDFWHRIAGHDVGAFRRRAQALMQEAAAIGPGNVEVLLRRGWCHLRERNWALAQRDFDAALALLPYDPHAMNECAFGLCHLGDLDRAEALMQRAFRLNPFRPSDYDADLAVLLALRGDAQAAEEHFALSGEQGLQYVAIRLANLGRLPDREAARETCRRRFVEGFGQAWQPRRPPASPDIIAWFDHMLPLRLAEHRDLLREGLEQSLGGEWRGAIYRIRSAADAAG